MPPLKYNGLIISFCLPWPSPKLSPNARVHYRTRSKYSAAARKYAATLALSMDCFLQNAREMICVNNPRDLAVSIVLFPPDNRRRDDDNVLASLKSYRDGLFEAIGVDDRIVRKTTIAWQPYDPREPGLVWYGIYFLD